MAVTVSGGGGTTLTFNVSGSAGNNFGNDFPGSYPVVSNLSTGGTESTVAGALNVFDSGANPATVKLTTGGQYTFVSTGQGTTVDGTAGGDTLIGGADFTYVEAATGGHNRVIFTNGTNMFLGSSVGGVDDTIAGGSGYDTIVTGAGPSTVFSGTGHTLVYLDDTVAGDVVVMQSGTTTVIGSSVPGTDDTVSATAGGVVYGGAGTVTFVAPGTTGNVPVDVTVVGGTGTLAITGGTNLDLTLTGGGTQIFQAGAGNETLDGATSGGFSFFGDTNAADSVATTVYGGSNDYFSTGVGNEYFSAGAGDIFNIASVSGDTNITINNFTSSDSVSFDSPTVSGTSDGTNYTVTLSDGTKVEFLGITSLPSHTT